MLLGEYNENMSTALVVVMGDYYFGIFHEERTHFELYLLTIFLLKY